MSVVSAVLIGSLSNTFRPSCDSVRHACDPVAGGATPQGGAGAVGYAVAVPVLHSQNSYQARCCIRSLSLARAASQSGVPTARARIAAPSASVQVGIAGGSVAQNDERVRAPRGMTGRARRR